MSDLISRADAIALLTRIVFEEPPYFDSETLCRKYAEEQINTLPSAEVVQGEWISEIDTGTWMLKCSVCGCRVQEEKYRIAVGENANKCPYCGAELGLGGYLYDEYANRPSERKGGDNE